MVHIGRIEYFWDKVAEDGWDTTDFVLNEDMTPEEAYNIDRLAESFNNGFIGECEYERMVNKILRYGC